MYGFLNKIVILNMSTKYIPNSTRIQPPKHINITPQQRLKVQTFWAKLQLGDLCFYNIVEYGIALFGQTKAGKTTLAHHLLKNTLVSKFNSRFGNIGYEIDSKSDRLTEGLIGLGNESQTDIPNQSATEIIVKTKVKAYRLHLFDCPGYSDSNGPLMIIANGYFHYRIFSKVKNLKFVLTFDGDYFETGKPFDKAANTITEFFNSFKDIAQIKKEIFAATSFLFTKIQNQKVQELLQIMKVAHLQKKTTYSLLISQLISDVLAKKKLFIFKRPQRVDINLEQNPLIDHFWQRESNHLHNQVDMSQIKISIASKIAADENSAEQFQILSTLFQLRFRQAIGLQVKQDQNGANFRNILRSFIDNSLHGQPQTKSFYTDFIIGFIKKFYIFDLLKSNPQYDKKMQQKRSRVKKQCLSFVDQFIEKSQVEWIQKLEITRLIYSFLEKYQQIQQGFPKEVEFFSKFSDQLLKILIQLKQIRFFNKNSPEQEAYVCNIEKFCYIIYRLLQQSKTFMIIFTGGSKQMIESNLQFGIVNVSPILFSTMANILDYNQGRLRKKNHQVFQISKINYISSIFPIKSNQRLLYYNEILNYCKQVNSKKGLFESKMVQLRNKMLETSNKQIQDNLKMKLYIQNIKSTVNQLHQEYSLQNSEKYIAKMNDLGTFLSKKDSGRVGGLQQKRKSLSYATKIYKYVNNVHQVILTYKTLISLYSSQEEDPKQLHQLQNILIECAQYASTHGRKQFGLEMLEYAYHLIDRRPQSQTYTLQKRRKLRQQLGEKIGFMGLRKSCNPSQSYYDSLIMGRFCEIIQQKFLNQLQQNYPNPDR